MRVRAIAVPAAMLLFTFALAGCSSAKPTGTAALSQTQSSPSALATPPTGLSPSAAPSGTQSATGGGGANPPSAPKPNYATTAKGYATNTVNAYTNGSKALLADYTSNGGAVEFANLPKTNMKWHFHKCAPDGTNTACEFDNDNGDELTVDIDPTYLGKPDAAVTAVVLVTTYPTTADALVGEFVDAWSHGNKYRMARLADAPSVDIVYGEHGDAPSGWSLSDSVVGDQTAVTIHPVPYGTEFTVIVDNTKLGHAHSMTAER
jgi:hypothetical protein